MRTETVSVAALGSAGFRYLYSVCFFRLFGPTGLWVSVCVCVCERAREKQTRLCNAKMLIAVIVRALQQILALVALQQNFQWGRQRCSNVRLFTCCEWRHARVYVYFCPSVKGGGWYNMSDCLLAPVCVLAKMKVTQTASQRFRPLHPLRPSSLPSWLHSSQLPMTMTRMLGVAMSTRCCQTQMGPRLFILSTCFPDSFR